MKMNFRLQFDVFLVKRRQELLNINLHKRLINIKPRLKLEHHKQL